MMVFTTLFLAAIILVPLYFVALRRIPWPWLGYTLVVVIGVLCVIPGDVHFRYVGIEVAGLGALVVWARHHFKNRKSSVEAA